MKFCSRILNFKLINNDRVIALDLVKYICTMKVILCSNTIKKTGLKEKLAEDGLVSNHESRIVFCDLPNREN